MKARYLLILVWFQIVYSAIPSFDAFENNPIVLKTKRIQFEDFPDAFNPSLLKIKDGYLFSFRNMPYINAPWFSYIYIVRLDEEFEPTSSPQRLNTRSPNSITLSQAEDARLFTFKGKIYLLYNDNMEDTNPSLYQRRDIYLAELLLTHETFSLSKPLKLVYKEKSSTLWQKNWTPFEWNQMFLLSYSLSPHEVLFPNLKNGECYFGFETETSNSWPFGILRGSTTAQLDEGEYLGFFHSSLVTSSASSLENDLWHYFMGAYTFSAEPPFEITKLSPKPLVAEGFYTISPYFKRVIFPAGFTIDGPYIYLAYGKDDREMWIATLDKQALKNSLVPTTNY